MRHYDQLARAIAIAAVSACAFADVTRTTAIAQSAPAGAPGPAAGANPQKSDAARRAYEAGVKFYGSGKHQQAIDQFSSALRGGGLAAPEMAKALYLRGLCYKQQKQPGRAISDLTSALWLKNGLSEADRQAATAERAEAYQMAGLSAGESVPPVKASRGSSAKATTAAPAAAADAVNSAAETATATAPVTRLAADSQVALDAAHARRNSAVSSDIGGLQAAASGTVLSSPAASAGGSSYVSGGPSLSAVPTGEETSAAQPGSAVPDSISGFFSNLFGGSGATQQQAPSDGVTTASTGPHEAAVSSWTDSTVVATASPAGTSGKSNSATAKKQSSAARAKGKYKVHIAALRSRSEAEALAKKVAAQYAGEMPNHTPTVDEAVIGSMGTFYRVRIGGYANQDEPRGLCNKLRTGGFDCLVVTN